MMLHNAFGALAVLSTAVCAQAQPLLTGLGDLPGGSFYSRARAVSADGLVVGGTSYSFNGTTGEDGCCEAFVWTMDSGMQGLGDLPGGAFESEVFALAADGLIAFGGGHIGVDLGFEWTAGLGIAGLPELDGGAFGGAAALAASANGSVVVGFDYGPNGREAFRLQMGAGVAKPLGDLPGGDFWSEATGVSADGQRIVGASKSGSGTEAFVWTAAQGMQGLGDLPGGGFLSRANAIAGDGLTIVGMGSSASGPEAFRWTQAEGLVGLGDLGGGAFASEALATSANGSVIVGRASGPGGDEAFIWTSAGGMRSLSSVLEDDFGLDLGGWQLRVAYGVSADGRTIVGRGVNPEGNTEAWLARLGGCYADCTGGGGLDLFDFLCFVNRFNAGDPDADCDADGVLSLFDFLCFVNVFNAGC